MLFWSLFYFRKEIEAIEESLDAAFQEDAFLEANLKNPQDSLRNAEMAQSDVYDIDRLHKDSKQLSRQIEKLKRDLPSNSKSRTFDEALAEQQVKHVQCHNYCNMDVKILFFSRFLCCVKLSWHGILFQRP